MFRTNDPFWSRQADRVGVNRGAQGVKGEEVGNGARAGARMALTDGQIGLFMKQSQTDFMNSPG